jgi:hypothetical protein
MSAKLISEGLAKNATLQALNVKLNFIIKKNNDIVLLACV